VKVINTILLERGFRVSSSPDAKGFDGTPAPRRDYTNTAFSWC